VKPAFDDFVLPSKKYADVIIPRGGDNHVAVDLIVQHIRTKLGQHDLCKIYPNVYVIHSTFQVNYVLSCLISYWSLNIFSVTALVGTFIFGLLTFVTLLFFLKKRIGICR
jgi:hypothetical protein